MEPADLLPQVLRSRIQESAKNGMIITLARFAKSSKQGWEVVAGKLVAKVDKAELGATILIFGQGCAGSHGEGRR